MERRSAYRAISLFFGGCKRRLACLFFPVSCLRAPLFLLSLASLIACSGHLHTAEEEVPVMADLPQLQEQGELVAVTLYSSTSYFQYKMQDMGYEYDLAKDFAKSVGLKLTMKVATNPARLIEMLNEGEADLVAYPIPIHQQLKAGTIYCGQEQVNRQVLIQREEKGSKPLTDVTQLIGKEVYVKANTRFSERLAHLNEEVGGGILIHEVTADSITTEDLIEQVSQGKIAYTISDDQTARLNKTYFWNLHIGLEISFPQRCSWVVRRSSPLLAEAIDAWASGKKGITSFKAITKRYFELSKQPLRTEIPPVRGGHISPYDAFFKKHAGLIGWDWQLLASISYQESRFNPSVVSWAGAEGLMGIMPNTAKALGVTPHELKDPDVGIRIGVDCLRRFRQGFSDITDPEEQIKFTLAAYNAGIGHVYDAQRLTRKYGKDPNRWEHVSEYIRLKNDPEYYNDPVCKHGYLRGSETYLYVREVMERYHYYMTHKNKA